MNFKILIKCLFLFVVFSTCTVINPVRKSPYKTYVANIIHKPFDVIIVPGIPYDGKKWNSIMAQRIYWAKNLYENKITKNILFSGAAVHTPYVESKIMKLYALELGIPSEHIYIEEKAEHTTENIYYSYNLAKEMGFNNIAIATDPYQINNLRSFLKKQNFDLKLLPIQYDSIVTIKLLEPIIDPSAAKVDSLTFVSLKKRESFFKRLRGTMGKNIAK